MNVFLYLPIITSTFLQKYCASSGLIEAKEQKIKHFSRYLHLKNNFFLSQHKLLRFVIIFGKNRNNL